MRILYRIHKEDQQEMVHQNQQAVVHPQQVARMLDQELHLQEETLRRAGVRLAILVQHREDQAARAQQTQAGAELMDRPRITVVGPARLQHLEAGPVRLQHLEAGPARLQQLEVDQTHQLRMAGAVVILT